MRNRRSDWMLPLVAGLLVSGCETGGSAEVDAASARSFTYAGAVGIDLPALDADPDPHETEHDWAIARGTVEWARSQGLGSVPLGSVAAILGSTFVGTPYEPGTLEPPGPERLVVMLRSFDCVTLVEHLLVLARIVVTGTDVTFSDDARFRERYRDELVRIRYRNGVLDGYPSRLHYFSEWIRDAEAKGLVRDISRELGGVEDPRPIHFMSSNPGSYRQLGEDPSALSAIREMEARLNRTPRYFIPQDRIAEVEDRIQDGDVIAAVSTLDGLDVAHTGIAIRHAGRVHLLHAPLVGDSVEISARPLAERIQALSGQQGIIVARPLEP